MANPVQNLYTDDSMKIDVVANLHDGKPYLRMQQFLQNETFFFPEEFFNKMKNEVAMIEKWWKMSDDRSTTFQLYAYGVELTFEKNIENECFIVLKKLQKNWFGGEFQEFHFNYTMWQIFSRIMPSISNHINQMRSNMENPEMKKTTPIALNAFTTVHISRNPLAMVLTRTPKQIKKNKWKYVLPMDAVFSFLGMSSTLLDFLKRGEEHTLPLRGNHHVLTVCHDDIMYAGFVQLNDKGERIRGCGMNMDTIAFKKLCRLRNDLEETLYLVTPGFGLYGETEKKTLEVTEEKTDEKMEVDSNLTSLENTLVVDEDMEVDQLTPATPVRKCLSETNMVVSPVTSTPVRVKRSSEIDLTPPFAPKKAKTIPQFQQIKQHKWVWLNENGELLRSGGWYYEEEICRLDERRAFKMRKEKITPNILFRQKIVAKPTYPQVVKEVIAYALWDAALLYGKAKCRGCEWSASSQVDHMDGGCMSDLSELVDKHLNTVKKLMMEWCPYLVYWAERVVRAMGYDNKDMAANVKTFLLHTPNEEWSKRIMEKSEDAALFRMVLEYHPPTCQLLHL